MFNGEPMYLDDCTGDGFSADKTGCTYDEFTTYLNKIWYSGPEKDDLDFACLQKPQPSDI